MAWAFGGLGFRAKGQEAAHGAGRQQGAPSDAAQELSA
jgi:hypothetical protein